METLTPLAPETQTKASQSIAGGRSALDLRQLRRSAKRPVWQRKRSLIVAIPAGFLAFLVAIAPPLPEEKRQGGHRSSPLPMGCLFGICLIAKPMPWISIPGR